MSAVAVLGATGYTGMELVRLLSGHQEVEIAFLSSESGAGRRMSDIHPRFRGEVDLHLKRMEVEDIPSSVELVFCALPHGRSASVVPALLKRGFKVVDLSADFRLDNAALYPEWYGREHPVAELLAEAVYGLPELNKAEISGANLVANPGCYPTSAILAAAPLLAGGIVQPERIIIDSKSGVSGAGREPKQPFHFPECSENFKAYRVADHQHTPEIEQELGRVAKVAVKVTFTPHLVPMIRGILSTLYLEPFAEDTENKLTGEALYEEFYRDCPFVRVMRDPGLPETAFVRGTNYCDLALREDPRTGRLIVLAAIDNLVKGASGQAVQNMNIMLGFPEETGLKILPTAGI